MTAQTQLSRALTSFTPALSIVLALTLSACGGGGTDTTTVTPVVPVTPTPPTTPTATSSLTQGRWASTGPTPGYTAIMVPATTGANTPAVDTLWALAQDASTLIKLKANGAVQTAGAVTGNVYTLGTTSVTAVSGSSYTVSSTAATSTTAASQQISIQPLLGTTALFDRTDPMSTALTATQANGKWQADLGTAKVNWTVDTAAANVNNLSGTSTTGCTYSGQSTVVTTQSLYKVQFTETCSGGGTLTAQTFAGIGTLSTDNTRLTVVATNGDETRAAALLFVKQPELAAALFPSSHRMTLFNLPQGEFTRALGGLRRVFTHVGLFSLVINLLLLAPSLYMLQTYDRVLMSRNEGTLVMLTLLLAGLLALEAALEYLRSLVMSRASAAVDLQMGVEAQLTEAQKELSLQTERMKGLSDSFDRLVIKAPVAGTVVDVAVNTVGGVVKPGDRVMDIVPADEALVVEAQLAPQFIDRVRPGLPADVGFDAYVSMAKRPRVAGVVETVSADVMTDPRTGVPYYTVRVRISLDEIVRLKEVKMFQGMQCSVTIKTGERTMLTYLLRPLLQRTESALLEP